MLDSGDDSEHTDLGFVEIFKIGTQDGFFGGEPLHLTKFIKVLVQGACHSVLTYGPAKNN